MTYRLGDWVDVLFFSLFALVLLLLIGVVVYAVVWAMTPYGPQFTLKARVKALGYHSAHTNIGLGISSGGQAVMAPSFSPQEYNVVMTLETGETWIEDDKILFEDVEQGGRGLPHVSGSHRFWVFRS